MKRFIIIAAMIAALITPIDAYACGAGRAPMITETIHLPSTITIHHPIKAKSEGRKIEAATVRGGKLYLRDGRKYRLKKQFRNILQDGDSVTVYRSKDRITKIEFKEAGEEMAQYLMLEHIINIYRGAK